MVPESCEIRSDEACSHLHLRLLLLLMNFIMVLVLVLESCPSSLVAIGWSLLVVICIPQSSSLHMVNLISWLLSTVLRVIKVLMKFINSVHGGLLELLITWITGLWHHWHVIGHLVVHMGLLGIEVRVLLVDITIDLWHGSLLVV